MSPCNLSLNSGTKFREEFASTDNCVVWETVGTAPKQKCEMWSKRHKRKDVKW